MSNDYTCDICQKKLKSYRSLSSHVRISSDHNFDEWLKRNPSSKPKPPAEATTIQVQKPKIIEAPKQPDIEMKAALEEPQNQMPQNQPPFIYDPRGAYMQQQERDDPLFLKNEVERLRAEVEELRNPPPPQQDYTPTLTQDQIFLRDFLKKFGLPDMFIQIQLRKMQMRSGLLPSVSELSADVSAFNKNFRYATFLGESYMFELANRQQSIGYPQPASYGLPYGGSPYNNPQPVGYDARPRETPTQGFYSEMEKFIKMTELLSKLSGGQDVGRQIEDALNRRQVQLENTQAIVRAELANLGPNRPLTAADVDFKKVESNHQLELRKLDESAKTRDFIGNTIKTGFESVGAAIAKTAQELGTEQQVPLEGETVGRSMFQADCPSCGSKITAPMTAKIIRCPSCANQFEVIPHEQPQQQPLPQTFRGQDSFPLVESPESPIPKKRSPLRDDIPPVEPNEPKNTGRISATEKSKNQEKNK